MREPMFENLVLQLVDRDRSIVSDTDWNKVYSSTITRKSNE